MVVTESEVLCHGEVESAAQALAETSKLHSFPSLGRQSSIYSLTLDEFQHTLCENGRNFGSMNMDEFLSNIWTAEENQAIHANNENSHSNQDEPAGEKSLTTQRSLPRQGSLSLPAPLCRKTVEEVWAEIHREQQEKQQQQQQEQPDGAGNQGPTNRQPTFGEMTLEDFLIKAGVVREACGPTSQHHMPAPPQAIQQYGLYQNNNAGVDPSFGIGPVISLGFSDSRSSGNAVAGGVSPYQTFPQSGRVVGEASSYGGSSKRNGGFPAAAGYSGGAGGGSGYGAAAAGQTLGIGSPVSPESSDGMCPGQVDNWAASQYGFEVGGMRGKKRIIDGPVEKVVERRQRRMIKNRESAARSRARKQAYTVELEAELNQLKEENARLKQILAAAEKKRRQELQEEKKDKPPTKAQKSAEKLRLMRRSLSLP